MLRESMVKIFSVSTVIIEIVCFLLISSCVAAYNPSDPNVPAVDSNSSQTPLRPMIIWYSRRWGGGLYEPLRLATSSGVFSHVILMGLHKFDVPSYLDSPRFKKAFKLCKENNVTVIWARRLYPGHKLNGFTLKDAFEPEYYLWQIRSLKQEARKMGVNLTALDAEPYTKCPLKQFKLEGDDLPKAEFEKISKAINIAVEAAGQVDFILPSRTTSRQHLYNATCAIGKLAIAEYTYYDIPWTHSKKLEKQRPYDIFGAYVGVTKENKKHPHLPFFTPKEILERQYLWAHKKGLFIFAGYDNPGRVAREFLRIGAIQPVQDSNDVR